MPIVDKINPEILETERLAVGIATFARMIDVSEKTAERMVAKRIIPSKKINNRRIVTVANIRKLIEPEIET
jgi:hypothetical protein